MTNERKQDNQGTKVVVGSQDKSGRMVFTGTASTQAPTAQGPSHKRSETTFHPIPGRYTPLPIQKQVQPKTGQAEAGHNRSESAQVAASKPEERKADRSGDSQHTRVVTAYTLPRRDPAAVSKPKIEQRPKDMFDTPLTKAVMAGNLDAVRNAKNQNTINRPQIWGHSPLNLALKFAFENRFNGRYDTFVNIAKELIKTPGIELNAKYPNVPELSQEEIRKEVEEQEGKVAENDVRYKVKKSGKTLQEEEIQERIKEEIKDRIIAKSNQIRNFNKKGLTALHMAALFGIVEIEDALKEAKADTRIRAEGLETRDLPLFYGADDIVPFTDGPSHISRSTDTPYLAQKKKWASKLESKGLAADDIKAAVEFAVGR